MPENNIDLSKHRIIISHALKGEPAQMKPYFNDIVRERIQAGIETRRTEIASSLFGVNESGDMVHVEITYDKKEYAKRVPKSLITKGDTVKTSQAVRKYAADTFDFDIKKIGNIRVL